MDRERSGYRTIYKSYVIDDGWNLPMEVVETIDIKVQMAWQDAYKKVCKEHNEHKGSWLTKEIAEKYAAMSWIWRIMSHGQYIGKVREIGKELQHEYGVTELEAINILNEQNVSDYVNKYYRIQHKIPQTVNEQSICDDVVNKYLSIAI